MQLSKLSAAPAPFAGGLPVPGGAVAPQQAGEPAAMACLMPAQSDGADGSAQMQGLLGALEQMVKELEKNDEAMTRAAGQASDGDVADAGSPPPQPAATTAQAAMPAISTPQLSAGAPAQAAEGSGAAPAQAGPPPVDPKTVLAGDATTLAAPDAKCPPGVTMDQMMNASGGLLKNLGNQELKGDGAKGITGGIKDNLAKKSGGTDASQIGTDPDVTWRALQNLQAFKNTPGSSGKPVPDDVRHNGNVSGLQPSHEVARGSTLGELQDWFKGAIDGPQSQLPKGDKVDENGCETSGLQQFGAKVLDGLSKVAGFFKDVIDNTIGKIPGIGKVLSLGADLIAGGVSDGLHAASDAASGHKTDAVDDVKKMGHDALSHISQAAEQARNLMKQTLGRIPGVGKFLAAGGDVLANVVSGAANVGDTAIAGGDVAAAAENMGKNAAGAAVGAVVGLVDPTGMVSGLAESGVDGALGAKPQVVQT